MKIWIKPNTRGHQNIGGRISGEYRTTLPTEQAKVWEEVAKLCKLHIRSEEATEGYQTIVTVDNPGEVFHAWEIFREHSEASR